MTASAPFSITINAASSVPQWFTDLPYSQWQLVGTGSLAGVAGTTNYALTHAWVGAAVDDASRKFVIAAPGGHNDFGGLNGVYEFRLGDAAPAWYATRVGTGNVPGSQGYNLAGVVDTNQPAHTHSYHRPCVAAGRVWLAGLDSYAGSTGYYTTSTFSYDLAQTSGGLWRQHGRLATSPANWLGGSACYDAVTDRLFSFPSTLQNGTVGYYFDVSNVLAASDVAYPGLVTGVQSIATPNYGGGMYNASVVANGLRRLVVLPETPASGLASLQLDNLGAGWSWHSVSGTLPFQAYRGGGFVYHEAARRFYSYNSFGNAIRVVEVPATVTNQWTGRSVTLGGLTAASGIGSDNGAGNDARGFSRFNIVQDMGNGEACLVWYPDRNRVGMYVCRVPAGGL